MTYRNRNQQTVAGEQLDRPEHNGIALDPVLPALDCIFGSNPKVVHSHLKDIGVTRSELWSHAGSISKQLPEKSYAINLCSSRYLFIVSYLAVILRNQTNLLPANRAQNTINELLKVYDNSYYITDGSDKFIGHRHTIQEHILEYSGAESMVLDPNLTASISFTSGSTGRPKAVHKTWREFQRSAELAVNRFGLKQKDWTIISTVPPQHMYGLETSVYWPLYSNVAIANCHPFFPEDIRKAVLEMATPCLLIATPAHLKACIRMGFRWENVAMVLSSTAPMDVQIAKKIEASFNAPLYEIFGSTETLSFASRRVTMNESWEPYQGISAFSDNNACYLRGGHLQQRHKLDDTLSVDRRGYFTVLGRTSDIVKIGGKRASLAELNYILNQIEGIEDGVYYRNRNERLAALVVSNLSQQAILAELRKRIDDVFLPRPLHKTDELPRNHIGKVIKERLEQD